MKNSKSYILKVAIFVIIVLIVALLSGSVINDDKLKSIESYQSVYVDKTKTFDIYDIIKQKEELAFKNYMTSGVSSTINDAVYWIKIPLSELSFNSNKSIIELSKPHLSHVNFYQISSSNELIRKVETGRNMPFSTRDINYRQFLFELDPDYLDGDIYFSIDTESYLQVPTKLWSHKEFIENSSISNLLLGLFYGALIVMILYNGFLAYSLRDLRYLFYVLFVLSFALLQTVWDGLSLQYIWPEFYKWDTIANAFLISICGIFLMAFNFFFFEVYSKKRLLLNSYYMFFLVSLISSTSMFFINMKLSIYLACSIALIALASSIFSFVISIPKTKSHYLYITAWSVFFYMAALSLLGGFNIIPYSVLSIHGVKIGILILVVLFSLALSYKIKEIEYQRVVEAEKGILLKKLHKVNKKITSTRDFDLLYQNILEGYQSFFLFEEMLIAIENDKGIFTLNTSDSITELRLDKESYSEYLQLDASNISSLSNNFFDNLPLKNSSNSIILPFESRTSRKGFVIFTLKSNHSLSKKIEALLIDYTYQISLTIENIMLIKELKLLAERDSLTKLYNRKAFFEKANQLINQTSDYVTSIVMIDIDHFKTVNDNYGHIAGDKALIYLSNELLNHFPSDSIIARYGGEEFVVIMQTKTRDEALLLIDSFRFSIEISSIDIDTTSSLHITISSGIAYMTDEKTIDILLEKADNLLYEAKKSGRNRVIAN